MSLDNNITEDSNSLETDLSYKELNRFASPKSCYIQLDNLQSSGVALDSDLQQMKGFRPVL